MLRLSIRDHRSCFATHAEPRLRWDATIATIALIKVIAHLNPRGK